MTCIVGIIDKKTNKVYMGGDSAGVGGRLDIRIRKDPKVFIRGPFIIGFTTSFRMGQLLMSDERFSIRQQKNDEPDYDYMVSAFIPAVQSIFRKGGWINEKEKVLKGGTFLVGYKGRLYCVDTDFQVSEDIDDFNSCGSGEDYALGSLYSTEALDMKPADRYIKHWRRLNISALV
jgi:ATP-dependent protease HslVU (ClpYQ) peptidase subunit